MGACGGEGVGGRPDPPDGRKSVADSLLGTGGLLFENASMVDFTERDEEKVSLGTQTLYPAVYSLKMHHWSILLRGMK